MAYPPFPGDGGSWNNYWSGHPRRHLLSNTAISRERSRLRPEKSETGHVPLPFRLCSVRLSVVRLTRRSVSSLIWHAWQRFSTLSSHRSRLVTKQSSISFPHVRAVLLDCAIPAHGLAFRIFNFTFFVYSIIEATEIRHLDEDLHAGFTSISVTTLTIFSHIVLGVAELAYVGLGYQIWKEFGWKVYKFLGADIQIKRIFAHYQIFLSLLRFDMFFAIGFSAQLIFLVLDKADAEYYLTIGALPLGVLILVGGHFAARYENKWLMFSFMLGCVCATVYFSFKLFRIYEGLNTTFVNVYKSMTAFGTYLEKNSHYLRLIRHLAGLSLFFLILTFIWGCIVMHNFGRGLKEQSKLDNQYRWTILSSGSVKEATSISQTARDLGGLGQAFPNDYCP